MYIVALVNYVRNSFLLHYNKYLVYYILSQRRRENDNRFLMKIATTQPTNNQTQNNFCWDGININLKKLTTPPPPTNYN